LEEEHVQLLQALLDLLPIQEQVPHFQLIDLRQHQVLQPGDRCHRGKGNPGGTVPRIWLGICGKNLSVTRDG
jgi:hypothetical protein